MAEESTSHTPLLTTSMRAWTHDRRGPPSVVLSQRADLPRPTITSPIASTQVLVRVHYAALNPAGSIMMQLCPSFLRTKPCIPELDFAGVVTEIGGGVDKSRELKVGSPVFGSIPVPEHLKGSGALGEYVAVGADCVSRVPDGVELREAAGLPVAGCTALCLMDKAGLRLRDKVLVNGAAGGIGSLATQMVRRAVGDEGYLVAVCSGENEGFVRELGANETIDRRTPVPAHEILANKYSDAQFDVVIDAYGSQSLFDNCTGFLKDTGSYVTVGIAFEQYTYSSMLVCVTRMLKNIVWPRILGGIPRTYVQVASACTPSGLEKLRQLSDKGHLKVNIDSCWGFDEVQGAYQKLLRRSVKGKVVVKVAE